MRRSVPVWVVVVILLAAAGAWQLVFWVTGIGRPPVVGDVAPPPPPHLPQVDTSWVDLDLYASHRPTWMPQ